MIYVAALFAVVMLPSGAMLTFFLMREVKRLSGFDDRLAVSRAEAIKVNPQHRVDAGRRSQAGSLFRELALATARTFSVLAPFGAGERHKLANMLRSAGFQHADALAIYLSVKFLAAVALGSVVSVAAAGSEALGEYPAVIGILFVVGAVIGGLVPESVLRARSSARIRRMSEALPNALDLLVMCLEAGLTFERALLTTAEELVVIERGLASELRALETELRVGSSHRHVMEDFRQRTPLEGLRDLATTLLQSERYGTPLAQAMRNIADNERFQRGVRMEEQAQRLPVLMSLPMMLLVLPGTMLLMAGPAFLQAMQSMKSVG